MPETPDRQAASGSVDVEVMRLKYQQRTNIGAGHARSDVLSLLGALERAQQEIGEANRAVARYRELVDVAYQALSAVADANLETHGRWAQGLARSTAGTINRQADAIDESGQAQMGQG
jgi:hypothetical protein